MVKWPPLRLSHHSRCVSGYGSRTGRFIGHQYHALFTMIAMSEFKIWLDGKTQASVSNLGQHKKPAHPNITFLRPSKQQRPIQMELCIILKLSSENRAGDKKTNLFEFLIPIFYLEFRTLSTEELFCQTHRFVHHYLAWFLGFLWCSHVTNNWYTFKLPIMKKIINSIPLRWFFRLIIIFIASYVTGLSFWWCLLAYLAIWFLFEFAKNMIVVILGIILVVGASLAMFFGLLTL